MKGCRLQPKMHLFTMWCNKKYKWLQRISNYGNLKVQSVLLKWWREIDNPTTQIYFKSWMKMQINVSSIHISAKYVQLKTLCSWIFLLQGFVWLQKQVVFKCQFLQKITLMPQFTQCQIHFSLNIVHAISSILLFISSSLLFLTFLSLCCFFFLIN